MLKVLALETEYADLPEGVAPTLKSYLDRQVLGHPTDEMTPFLPKEFRDKQREYAELVYRNVAESRYDFINDVELREVEKFGPFSIKDPWALRRDHLQEYFVQNYHGDAKVLDLAKHRVSMLLKKQLQPGSLGSAFANLPSGTNLGLPWFSSSDEFRGDYYKRAVSLLQSGFKYRIYNAVIGWRGQPNGSMHHIKNRDVWMMDHLETIIGLSIQMPLLQELRKRFEFAAWNTLDQVDRAMTTFLDVARHEIISVDFSGFDQSVPAELIHAAFDVIRSWFDKSASKRIDWLEDQFLHVGIDTPDGVYTGRNGGVPSGSALTNLIDCLVHLIVWAYVSIVIGNRLVLVSVMGDDGVVYFERPVQMHEIELLVKEAFGMSVSADKGGFSRDIVSFAQRVHNRNYRPDGVCRGVRSIVRTWNGACHLERRISDLPPEFFSARTIMQLEYCKWHPNFMSLMDLYYDSDKYARIEDPAEIFKRAGGVRKVEKVLRLQSFRKGHELPSAGLDQFAVVQELRRRREQDINRASA